MASKTPPSHVAGLPPEIWAEVGEQIVGKKTLTMLTYTCRAFQSIFTPFLYTRQVIPLHEYSCMENPKEEHLPSGFRYTQHIEFVLNDFVGMEHDYEYKNKESFYNNIYANQIIELVSAMPQLKSFSFRDDSNQWGNGPALILRNPDLLHTLTAHNTLRNLAITFQPQPPDDGRRFNSFISLQDFEKLSSLELFNFQVREHEEEQFIRDLAKVLIVCPGLKKLGLGRELGYLRDAIPVNPWMVFPNATVLSELNVTQFRFFENLCHEYSSMPAAVPLGLTTLRLGAGMFLLNPDSRGVKNYLRKFLKLNCLKTLHIWNCNINRRGTAPIIANGITFLQDWTLLKGLTSLHHVEINELDDRARQWLTEDATTIEELVVRGWDGLGTPYRGDLNFDNLRLRNLGVLVADEDSGVFRYEFAQPNCSVLDHLYDHGKSLRRLAVSLDFRSQWAQFSTHLRAMPNLTQLSIQRRPMCGYPFLGNVNTKKKDVAKTWARLAKWKCPSLQMICIGVFAWHLTAEPGVELLAEGEITNAIQLRLLELDEMLSVDLFAKQNFCSARQCGLSDRPQTSEILDHMAYTYEVDYPITDQHEGGDWGE